MHTHVWVYTNMHWHASIHMCSYLPMCTVIHRYVSEDIPMNTDMHQMLPFVYLFFSSIACFAPLHNFLYSGIYPSSLSLCFCSYVLSATLQLSPQKHTGTCMWLEDTIGMRALWAFSHIWQNESSIFHYSFIACSFHIFLCFDIYPSFLSSYFCSYVLSDSSCAWMAAYNLSLFLS